MNCPLPGSKDAKKKRQGKSLTPVSGALQLAITCRRKPTIPVR